MRMTVCQVTAGSQLLSGRRSSLVANIDDLLSHTAAYDHQSTTDLLESRGVYLCAVVFSPTLRVSPCCVVGCIVKYILLPIETALTARFIYLKSPIPVPRYSMLRDCWVQQRGTAGHALHRPPKSLIINYFGRLKKGEIYLANSPVGQSPLRSLHPRNSFYPLKRQSSTGSHKAGVCSQNS